MTRKGSPGLFLVNFEAFGGMATTYLSSPEDLLAAAQLGRKLKPRERLAVVMYLERNGKTEDYAERDLAKVLGCSVASLQKYRRQARQLFAAAISADEAMNLMADFVRWYDILIAEALRGLRAANINTGGHQTYLRLLAELWDNKINKLQSVGVIPKELGRLTSLKEEWVAETSPDGVVSVRSSESASEGVAS